MSAETIVEKDHSQDLRTRILSAASKLIAARGSDAATTRAVAAAARVQPPAIYRVFGDKAGLLSAVAEYELMRYIAEKEACDPHPDPVEDLRLGWDTHIEFCLSNPGLFEVLHGANKNEDAAIELGMQVLRRRIRRVAQAGRLTTSEERALGAIQATAIGTITNLLGQTASERDHEISAFNREMVIAAVTRETANLEGKNDRLPQAAASTLQAFLYRIDVLSPGERHLLQELLERIARSETVCIDSSETLRP